MPWHLIVNVLERIPPFFVCLPISSSPTLLLFHLFTSPPLLLLVQAPTYSHSHKLRIADSGALGERRENLFPLPSPPGCDDETGRGGSRQWDVTAQGGKGGTFIWGWCRHKDTRSIS